MPDHIIEIPDDARIGLDHEESVVETLQIQVEAQHEPKNNLVSQPPPTERDTLVEDRSGEHSSSEGSNTLMPTGENSTKKAEEPESTSPEEFSLRLYFEKTETNAFFSSELETFEEPKDPISLNHNQWVTFTSWSIDEPDNNRGLYDVVLGVSIADFNIDAIEAIIVTSEQTIGTYNTYKSEVIGPAELKRLCAGVPNKFDDAKKSDSNGDDDAKEDHSDQEDKTKEDESQQSDNVPEVVTVDPSAERDAAVVASPTTPEGEAITDKAIGEIAALEEKTDGGEKDGGDEDEKEKEGMEEKKGEVKETILRWKMRQNFVTLKKDGGGTTDMVIEIKTWNDMPSDYGTFKLHFVELHYDARQYYGKSTESSTYREHRPYLGTVDINRTGYPEHDRFDGPPKTVTSYCMSRFGTHLLLKAASGTNSTIQLWDLRDPSDVLAATTRPSAESAHSKSRRPSTSADAKPTEKTPRPSMDPDVGSTEKSVCLRTESSGRSITAVPLLQGAPVTSPSHDEPVLPLAALDEPADNPADEESPNITTSDSPQATPSKEPYPITLLAWMSFPHIESSSIDISLSADGTQIMIQDITTRDLEDEEKESHKSFSQALRYTPGSTERASSDFPTGFGFSLLDVGDCWSKLKSFIGVEEFHITDTNATDVTNELFVTYDGAAVEVYTVFGRWTHVRTIIIEPSLYPVKGYIRTYYAMYNQLRGKYFVVDNGEQSQVTTWNIEEGRRVSFITELLSEQYFALSNLSAVSKDGTLIAIPGRGLVSFYRTLTWTMIGTCVLDEIQSDDQITDTMFVNADSQLIVTVAYGRNQMHLKNRDFIIDVKMMKVVGLYVAAGSDGALKARSLVANDQLLACVGDTTVDIFRLQDRVLDSPTKARSRCDERCHCDEAFRRGKTESTLSSGLTFKVEKLDAQVGSHGRRDKRPLVTATVTDPDDIVVQRLAFTFPIGASFLEAGYFCECKYLSVVLDSIIFVWRAPTSKDDEFRLLHVYYAEEEYKVNICSHEQLYWRRADIDEGLYYDLDLDTPFRAVHTYNFLEGVLQLIQVYESAGVALKDDIIRYVGERINMYPNPTALEENVVSYICTDWTTDSHVRTLAFIKALLGSPLGRWLPLENMPDIINPIRLMLDHASTHPIAITVAEVIIDYCIRVAKVDEDPHFLEPIRRCLHDLTDPKKPYSEIALKTLRGFGHFPARGRQVILEYHVIAHPHKFRWRFWKPDPRSLHQYKNQVLQISPTVSPNPPKDNFTRDLFTASFDMLWHKTGPADEEASDELAADIQSRAIFSWPMAFVAVIRRTLKVTNNATVECHSFETAALDNPALIALVEYKWNTIGYNYWLFRFLAQCCFYALVLIAVLMQTYGYNNNGVYEGIFIAIFVASIAFLWLEILQLLKDRQGYIQSIYNTVDLLAFLFPLAGSIYELCVIWGANDVGLNPPLLSFSVLFIFLHFLFELRVIRSVCQFVSIIIKAIASIRVFFFVFAGGILGFSIALLHLLHTCVDEELCPTAKEGFSNNMLRSISMTYFMMGGRYDPISIAFGTNNVGFHVMLFVFFFFTVILMLNVLIALINHAIDDGDQTWQLDWLQNRMRYVESAENLTYDIPGFRTSNKWFPETIYYTGTPQQVRDYEKETRRLVDESAPVAVSVTVAEEVQVRQVNLGGGDDTLVVLLKQYHEEQKKNHELQTSLFDEQKKTITELRNELRLLRERFVQQQQQQQ
ncbi:hypothetical protein BGZ95_007327 [Linnemannia exigua]|uniref:Ion transport domain-containing protein n=1 Tax=Linnemannia exigua TaxID=604196 RepID=A0AAD4H922_9FUNG|nr:hypothetical protein BGZ95_007327 [Linnemannia exigua]